MLCLQQGQRCYVLGQWPYFMFTTITGKWPSTYCPWLLLWASGLMLHQWCMKDNNSKLHQSFQHGTRGSCFSGILLTSVTSIMQLWLILFSSDTFDYKSLRIIGSWVTYLLTGQWPQITSQLQKRLTCDISLKNLVLQQSLGADYMMASAVMPFSWQYQVIVVSLPYHEGLEWLLCRPVADLQYPFFSKNN